MANNDDLFEGLEVNGEVVAGPDPTVALSPKLEPVDNSDLFEGLGIVSQVTPETGQRGFLEAVTGSERIAARPELGTLPEFATTKEGDTPRMALGFLSTFDPQAQIDMIKYLIPDAKFETFDDGSIIIEVPKKEGGIRRSVLNRPGLSWRDLADFNAQALAFIPATKLAGLGKTTVQKAAIGAAGAGATEQGLQETGMLLGRKERDPGATALAAGLGGVGEVVVPAFQAFRGASRARR